LTVIKVTADGPLRVKGPVTVVDSDGVPFEITRKTFFLCRCGASANKPFCDGSHRRIGFTAVETVPRVAAVE
jgi:CDGSH iron-sulfur domain-containing protein 3